MQPNSIAIIRLSDFEARRFYRRYFTIGFAYRDRLNTYYPEKGFAFDSSPSPFTLDQANNYFQRGAWLQYPTMWGIPADDAAAAGTQYFLPSDLPPSLDFNEVNPDYKAFGFYFLSGLILWTMQQIHVASMAANALSCGSGGPGGLLDEYK